MKYNMMQIAGLAVVMCGLGGCRSYQRNEVVNETYIHKYGVPVAKEDWSRNGRDGKIVQQRTDGVIVAKNYEKGIQTGETTYTFPNSSTIQSIENYEAGVLVSKVENYPSGIAKAEERYMDNALTKRLRWYEDGTPSAIENYRSGCILSAEYRNPLNEIDSRVEDGRGIRNTFDSEGELVFKDTIESGYMTQRTAYQASGDPLSITSYKNGKVHGTRLTFLPGGLPNTAEEWVEGEQEGVTTVYLNGEKIADVPYVKGIKEGIERRYRDGQTLVEEVSWKQDIQHGPRKLIIDENTTKTEWYQQGEVVSRTAYERMNHR